MAKYRFCRTPAAFIVRDAAGIETWVCAVHADDPRWIVRTPFADWYKARGFHVPRPEDRSCPEWVEAPAVVN